jgi:hypothetical protein
MRYPSILLYWARSFKHLTVDLLAVVAVIVALALTNYFSATAANTATVT